MDPLVDEYNQLKTGNINGETRAKANHLIRTFIIQISLASVALCVINYMIIYAGNQFYAVK